MKLETNYNGICHTHPVINPHKPKKLRRMSNAAAKYQGVALNDKMLSGPDLLQSLIGKIFRFREHQIALSADIEAMFLQIAVPSGDNDAYDSSGENIQSRKWKYTSTHDTFLGQKARRLVQITLCTKWRKISLVKTVQQNFYMNDFLESAKTPQEAIEIYQKVRDILSKGGFKLTKWITSDDEVKLQIPETDRSTKVVKTLEAEPQSSSILGLNLNVDTDSLIVCRGTE